MIDKIIIHKINSGTFLILYLLLMILSLFFRNVTLSLQILAILSLSISILERIEFKTAELEKSIANVAQDLYTGRFAIGKKEKK